MAASIVRALQASERFVRRELKIMQDSFEPGPSALEQDEIDSAKELIAMIREALKEANKSP